MVAKINHLFYSCHFPPHTTMRHFFIILPVSGYLFFISIIDIPACVCPAVDEVSYETCLQPIKNTDKIYYKNKLAEK